jgi:thioredoxin-related protein
MCITLLFILLILLIIIIFLLTLKKNNESFDNLESNLFTYDSCCDEKEIRACETYGKTGVCNYNQKNKLCVCQDSY